MHLADITEQQLQSLMGHDGKLLASSCAPNGAYIVTAGRDGTVRLRSAVNGSPARLIGLHGGVQQIAFQSDEAFTTSSVWEIVSWKLPTHVGRHAVALGMSDPEITATAFSSSGDLVATGHRNGSIRLWNSSGAPAGEPIGDKAKGSRVALRFTPDSLLAVHSNGMEILPLSKGGGSQPEPPVGSGTILAAAFSPDSVA